MLARVQFMPVESWAWALRSSVLKEKINVCLSGG